ncbi:unnamed protein product [Vitrella brassicaformis CCMP3155]|uniref:HMG box domain-containing protein n=1 Tax=Vitrella brassicaformis (strain CCMP3155) TaxID=1169540 RepID=A0A0G4EIS0_VITBC|nr:unnamed protein product [Vitrella brassicaformis CCMP3155]|mmetsp:Transcript_24931/g.71939  ORF Transcript_24931/g.71939 Transcript_24931/m.71939 type:complete len:511 (-) Transcript_24931:1534-3066(-)|eukprot:CEL96909.1 unnamed protein product [Vitrella brassicaformis CCMP3155]
MGRRQSSATAFFKYLNHRRPELKQIYPGADSKQMACIAGDEWQQLDQHTKELWKEAARLDADAATSTTPSPRPTSPIRTRSGATRNHHYESSVNSPEPRLPRRGRGRPRKRHPHPPASAAPDAEYDQDWYQTGSHDDELLQVDATGGGGGCGGVGSYWCGGVDHPMCEGLECAQDDDDDERWMGMEGLEAAACDEEEAPAMNDPPMRECDHHAGVKRLRRGDTKREVRNRSTRYKRRRTDRQAGGPLRPKMPLSPFLFFQAAERPAMEELHPELSYKQILVALGERWRRMTKEEKRIYDEAAAQDRVRYYEECRQLQEEQKALEEASPKDAPWVGGTTLDELAGPVSSCSGTSRPSPIDTTRFTGGIHHVDYSSNSPLSITAGLTPTSTHNTLSPPSSPHTAATTTAAGHTTRFDERLKSSIVMYHQLWQLYLHAKQLRAERQQREQNERDAERFVGKVMAIDTAAAHGEGGETEREREKTAAAGAATGPAKPPESWVEIAASGVFRAVT